MESIGFHSSFLNKQTNLFLTEVIREGNINGFQLICDLARNKKKVIEFKALVKRKELSNERYTQLSMEFKRYEIEFGIGTIIKQYNTSQLKLEHIHDLKDELEHFTTLLKKEGFEPLERT